MQPFGWLKYFLSICSLLSILKLTKQRTSCDYVEQGSPIPGCSLFGTGLCSWQACACARSSPCASSGCLLFAYEAPLIKWQLLTLSCEAPFM